MVDHQLITVVVGLVHSAPNNWQQVGKSGNGLNEVNGINFKTHFNINDTNIGEHINNQVYFAGGGGGGADPSGTWSDNAGGLGGGGDGQNGSTDFTSVQNAKPNTGGGGGGNGQGTGTSGKGGSGIIIIRYKSNSNNKIVTNELKITNENSKGITIDNSGFVGFNKDTPENTIDVDGNINIQNTENKTALIINQNIEQPVVDINCNNESKLFIDYLGNIGINNNQPQEKLDIGGNVIISSNLTINSNLQVNNNTIIENDLLVNNDTTIDSNLQVNNNAIIENDLLVNNDTTIDSNLQVNNNAIIENDLLVNNNTTIDSNLQVNNNAIIENELLVNNNTTISSNLLVKNSATIENDLLVNNNTTIDSNLQVNNNAIMRNNLQVNNNAIITSNLTVSDINIQNSFHKTALIINQIIEQPIVDIMTNEQSVLFIDNLGNIGINNNQPQEKLDIEGNVIISSNLTISSNLQVNNNAIIENDLFVNNNTTISSNLQVNNNAIIENDLFVNNNTTISSNLIVNSNLDVKGSVNIYNDLIIPNINNVNNIKYGDETFYWNIGVNNQFIEYISQYSVLSTDYINLYTWYKFENNYIDYINNNNITEYLGSEFTTDAVFNSSIKINDGYTILIPHKAVIPLFDNVTSPNSFSFWFKINSEVDYIFGAKNVNDIYLSKIIDNGSGSKRFYWNRYDNRITDSDYNGNSVYFVISDNELFNTWHHIAYISDWNETTGNITSKIYLNGINKQVTTDSEEVTADGWTNPTEYMENSVLTLGGYNDGITYNKNGIKYFDDVRIYNKALTYIEVANLYNNTSVKYYTILQNNYNDLIAWYKFDDDFNDSSGNNNHLSIGAGTPSLSSSEYVIGKSANLLEDSHYLKNNNISLANKEFSIALWVKVTSYDTDNFFISQGTTANYQYLQIGTKNNKEPKYTLAFWGNDLDSPETYYEDINKWVHLVFIVNSTNNRSIYRNGFSIATDTNTTAFTSSEELRIGTRRNSHNNDSFTGYMDDLRIYNRGLTPDEIQKLANKKYTDNNDTLYINKNNNKNTLTIKENYIGLNNYDPTNTLDIIGNINIDNTSSSILNTALVINQTSSYPIIDFKSNNDSVLFISKDKLIGINNNSPEYNLDINGDINTIKLYTNTISSLSHYINIDKNTKFMELLNYKIRVL